MNAFQTTCTLMNLPVAVAELPPVAAAGLAVAVELGPVDALFPFQPVFGLFLHACERVSNQPPV